MKKIILIASSLLACFSFLSANGGLTADIDNDGYNETLTWKPFASSDGATFFQLYLIDDNGRVLWQGPKTKKAENPYFVGKTDIGISLPELFTDIDGDGFTELLIPELQSDVSPTAYHCLRWIKNRFHTLSTRTLVMKDAYQSSALQWRTVPDNDYHIFWVSHFHQPRSAAKYVSADIIGYWPDREEPASGTAKLHLTPNGATVIQWIKSLNPNPFAQSFQQVSLSDIHKNPKKYVNKTIRITGINRCWESPHNTGTIWGVMVSRSDCIFEDTTGAAYVKGLGRDTKGQTVSIMVTVKIHNGKWALFTK